MALLMEIARRAELTQSINSLTFQDLKLSRERRRLSNFTSVISSGQITPSAITSIDCGSFYAALNFMQEANDAATQVTETMWNDYEQKWGDITKQQYYNSPTIAARAELYFDENDNIDKEAVCAKLYEQALKDFVVKYVEPKLKELDEKLELEQQQIETERDLEKAELDAIKNAISEEIQNSAIKL